MYRYALKDESLKGCVMICFLKEIEQGEIAEITIYSNYKTLSGTNIEDWGYLSRCQMIL